MRLFRVVTEYDSRAPEAKKGERTREERWFAAETIEAVWDAIAIDRIDAGIEVIALIEHAPSISVVGEPDLSCR